MGLLTPLYIFIIGENRPLIMTKNIDFFFLNYRTQQPVFCFAIPPPQSQAKSTKIAINFKKYFAALSKFRLHSDVLAISKGRMLQGTSPPGLEGQRPAVPISSGFGIHDATD